MNVWRPIVRAVMREPLAMLDAATCDESDLIGVLRKTLDHQGRACEYDKMTSQYSEGYQRFAGKYVAL